jgi:hypothetical protein
MNSENETKPGQEPEVNSTDLAKNSEDNISSLSEFDIRLEELRRAIKPAPELQHQRKFTATRIRLIGLILSAFVFAAILFMERNGTTAELPGAIFLAILISAIVVCLVELIIMAIK